jgi:mycothiol synthase
MPYALRPYTKVYIMIDRAHIQSRPYAGEQDLQPLVDLTNRCEEHDRVDWGITLNDLRWEIEAPGVDPQRDLRLWEDARGRPVALGQLHVLPTEHAIDIFFWFCVEPELRGVELEDALFAWGRERAGEIERERGRPVDFAMGARSTDGWRTAVIARQGLRPDRYFLRMVRPLDQPIADPVVPAGFQLRTLAGAQEVPQWVELYNLSFVDHWHFHRC